MKTITMTDEDKNIIAVGTEVVATHDTGEYSAGGILIITQQDYDYMPAAIKKGDAGKFGDFYISVKHFSVLDTSTTATFTYEPGQTPTQSDEQIKRSLPVGTRVRLTADLHSTLSGLQVGCEGRIAEQDGSDMPYIEFDSFVNALYVETKDFEAIPDVQPVEVTQDNLAFGQVYRMTQCRTSSENVNVGDLLVLLKNDGSNNPFFTRLGDGEQVVAYLDEMVAVNVIESKQSKQSKELET